MPIESIPVDLESFMVIFFCIADDLYIERFASLKPVRPGAKPEMSASQPMVWKTFGALDD